MRQGDIRFTHDSQRGYADIALSGGDLVRDGGFETAVLISLFTDRHADPTDTGLDNPGDRRGWFGEQVMPAPVGTAHPRSAAISGGISFGIFTILFSETIENSLKVVIAPEFICKSFFKYLHEGISKPNPFIQLKTT